MKAHFTLFILLLYILSASAQNWYSSPVNNGRDVNCIKLFNRDSVIVAGGWEHANGDSTRSIFKSENGGLYLWNVPVDGNQHWIKSMDFIDSNNGIAVGDGGQIIKTTDSGWNWTAENGPVLRDYNRIFLTNSQTFMIVGGTQKDSVSPHRQTVLQSTNGGQSWNVVHDEQGEFWLRSVYFISQTTGYAVGDSGTILKSTTGGTSWIPISAPVQRNFNAIWFKDALNGFIVGGYPENDSIQTILQTTDGGNNWTVSVDRISSMLRDVHYVNGNTWFAVGDDATVLRTIDGGQNWIRITIPGTVGDEQFNAVRFYSSDFGYISGKWGVQYIYNEKAAPEAFTSSAAVADTHVTVTGLVHTHGEFATWNFQFSYASDFSNPFAVYFSATTRNNSFEELSLHIPLFNFDPDTTVYFAIEAQTMGGKVYGDTLSFVTTPTTASIQTLEATNVTTNSAEINGSVRGYSGTVNLVFQYGVTPALGSQVAATPPSVSDTALQNVSANLSNLQNHTFYYYRLRGTTNTGTFYGNIRFFYTGAEDSYSALITQPATNVIDTSAVLNGLVNGFKVPATIRFEYSNNLNGFGTAPQSFQLNDSLPHSFSTQINGLEPNMLYYARIKAETQLGTFYGDTIAFFTLSESPFVKTLIAANVTTSSAQLLGQIQKLAVPVVSTSFEYGTSLFLGSEISASPSVINDTLKYIINATLSGLNDNTMYYYRLKAVTDNGAVLYGEIKQVYVGIPTIPNWDFQEWTDTTAYISNDWVMLGERFGRVQGHTGNYAMEIHAPGIITLGIFGGFDQGGIDFIRWEPFPYEPDSVVFWAKCTLAPDDTALMFLAFLAEDTFSGGYEGAIAITNTNGIFKRFSAPVRSMQPPDSIGIFIAVGTLGTSITIDNITFTSASGSGSFPNYGFEDWFDYHYQDLDEWKYLKYGVFDTTTASVMNPVTRTYFKQPDDYAAEVRNPTVGADGYQSGEIASYLGILGSPLPTIPVSERHRVLNGYFQYYPENGDSLSIIAYLTKNGQTLASGIFTYGDSISEFRPFEMQLHYIGSADTAGDIPDKAIIAISARKEGPFGASRLIIDKLSFDGYRGEFVAGVGVKPVEAPAQKLLLFPNPATSVITIQLETEVNERIQLEIYGMDGKLVHTQQFPERSKSIEVDVKDFAKGLYVAQVYAGKKRITNKFIVLK